MKNIIIKNKKFIIVVIIGILVIVAIAGNKGSQSPVNQAPLLSPSITPPPAPVFDNKSEITVTNNGFQPSVFKIKTNTLVTWINNSGASVSIASDPHPQHTDYPSLNLGNFGNGYSVSLIFNKPGTYKYHNHFKPAQTGVVIVQ